MQPSIVQLKPRMSEKAYAISQAKNVYVFDVTGNSSKQAIASAIEQQFDVTVLRINVTNIQGKTKRTIAKKGKVVQKGRNASVKKAYVTLKPDDKLPFFAAVEEAEAKEKAAEEKAAKTEQKEAEKTVKKPRRGLHLRAKKTEDE